MSRRFDCPLDEFEGVWIELPDEWLGEHATRYDQAIEDSRKLNSATMTNFAVALAIAEDWRIPGLEGKPEAWDFGKINLSVISWISKVAITDYLMAVNVPKNSFGLSPNGQKSQPEKTEAAEKTKNEPD